MTPFIREKKFRQFLRVPFILPTCKIDLFCLIDLKMNEFGASGYGVCPPVFTQVVPCISPLCKKVDIVSHRTVMST